MDSRAAKVRACSKKTHDQGSGCPARRGDEDIQKTGDRGLEAMGEVVGCEWI